MQAQIPQELSALMALSQGMQQGRVATTTPDGDLTVAAQKVGEVEGMLPGMQQAVGQAGLGAQIKAMQMQEAQKAMMNAAMQQTRPPAGIERLNPQMGNFAEGGIVGYAPGGVSQEFGGSGDVDVGEPRLRVPGPRGDRMMTPAEMRAEKYPEDYIQRRLEIEGYISRPEKTAPPASGNVVENLVREQAPPPVAATDMTGTPVRQPSVARPFGGAGGIGSLLRERERAVYASMKGPPTPEEIMAQEQREAAIQDQYLRSKGLPTTAEMFAARGAEDKSLVDQQRALLRERMERESGRDTFLGRMGEALRGFSQMKGQGIGPGLGRSYEALSRRLAAGEVRMDQMRDFELKINELEINRRRALDDARRATAEGDWKRAQQRMGEVTAFENAQKNLTASTYDKEVKALLEESKIAESAANRADAAKVRSEQSIDAQLSRSIEVLRKIENDIRSKYKDSLERFSTMRAATKGNLPEAMAQEEARLVNQRDNEVRIQTANIRNQIRALETQRFGAPIEPEVRMTATMEDIRATAAKRNVPVETVIAQAKAKGYIITGQ